MRIDPAPACKVRWSRAMDPTARLGDVESHIYAALEKAGDSPRLEDLEVILAGMDPPSSYAALLEKSPRRETQPRLCRLAIAGAAWAPFAVLLLGMFVPIRVPARYAASRTNMFQSPSSPDTGGVTSLSTASENPSISSL